MMISELYNISLLFHVARSYYRTYACGVMWDLSPSVSYLKIKKGMLWLSCCLSTEPRVEFAPICVLFHLRRIFFLKSYKNDKYNSIFFFIEKIDDLFGLYLSEQRNTTSDTTASLLIDSKCYNIHNLHFLQLFFFIKLKHWMNKFILGNNYIRCLPLLERLGGFFLLNVDIRLFNYYLKFPFRLWNTL